MTRTRNDKHAGKRPASPTAMVLLVILGLSFLVLAIYWQVGGYGFINLDDPQYATNPQVLRGLTHPGMTWAFTTFSEANWHPLTWLSLMADVELFGASPQWHHRVNILLHCANTVLLFLVLWRMTGGLWQSAFVAALFGVHPLHVESVAWVAERKDVLSTLFWLLTMGMYLRYVRKPGVGRYLAVAASLALGLMCKPMLVTLPFVLLLLDGWPLARLSPEDSADSRYWRLSRAMLYRRILEKAPLFGLSAASCVITYLAQAGAGAVIPLDQASIGIPVSNALVSYATYLGKAVWPASLSVYYPHPMSLRAGIHLWKVVGAVLLLGGISFLALREIRRRPYLAVGWFWYLGTLVPVIGLVQVGATGMADRYTYVPLIGVFIAAGWGVPDLLAGWRYRRSVLGVTGIAVVVALSAAAWAQAGYWRDSVKLFSRAIAVTEENWLALTNLGTAYDDLGNSREAIGYFREALRIKPDYAFAWYRMGMSSQELGLYEEALVQYREAVRFWPANAKALYKMGGCSEKLGRYEEAVVYYREAVRIWPDYAVAWNNLGGAVVRLGRNQEAIGYYREAVRIQPDYALGWYNLGVGHALLNQFPEAIKCLREAARLKPDFAKAWYSLGLVYKKIGREQDASDCFQEAERILGKQGNP